MGIGMRRQADGGDGGVDGDVGGVEACTVVADWLFVTKRPWYWKS